MSSPPPNENPLQDDLDHILEHTRELWEDVRGKSILVTGGTGFFGRWLLESFAHANRSLRLEARAVVLSRDPDTFAAKATHLVRHSGIEFVRGDVRTFTSADLHAQLKDDASRFDYVIHAATAASAKLNAENPLLMIDTIVEGTRAALKLADCLGAERFLLTSSGAVYGTQPTAMTHIPEDYVGGPDCTNADNAYAEGKRLAELLCAAYHRERGMKPLIARCFAFVGPFLPLDAHFAIGNFIRDALNGGPIRVGGDGTPFRSYLYAADLAVWLWTILLRGVPMRPYNVGSAEDITIAQLASAVRETIAPNGTIEIAREPAPGAAASRYVPAVDRAESELGLRVSVGLPEAIGRTARAHRLNSAQ